MGSTVVRLASGACTLIMVLLPSAVVSGCALLNSPVNCAERETALRLQRDLASTGLFSETELVGSCDDEDPIYAVAGAMEAQSVDEVQGVFEGLGCSIVTRRPFFFFFDRKADVRLTCRDSSPPFGVSINPRGPVEFPELEGLRFLAVPLQDRR
ncbi:MAG: hypothetical protein ACRCYU_22190 [Nocardioides sp.]